MIVVALTSICEDSIEFGKTPMQHYFNCHLPSIAKNTGQKSCKLCREQQAYGEVHGY
jgi:hypothetical protein